MQRRTFLKGLLGGAMGALGAVVKIERGDYVEKSVPEPDLSIEGYQPRRRYVRWNGTQAQASVEPDGPWETTWRLGDVDPKWIEGCNCWPPRGPAVSCDHIVQWNGDVWQELE